MLQRAIKRLTTGCMKNPRWFLSLGPRFKFASESPETQLKIRYIQDWDVQSHENLLMAFMSANCIEMVIHLVKENLGWMTDEHLSYAVNILVQGNLDLNEEFYNFLVPLFKDYLKIMTRENTKAITDIISSFANLQVKDQEFWEIVERKLMKEKIVRYLELHNLCEVAISLGTMYKGSPELFAEIEKHILNQRARLNENEVEALQITFKNMGVGSSTFFKALEDKSADIEKLHEEERILKIRRIAAFP